jgi:hypothetical protein
MITVWSERSCLSQRPLIEERHQFPQRTRGLIAASAFLVTYCYFGPRDAFINAVITPEGRETSLKNAFQVKQVKTM